MRTGIVRRIDDLGRIVLPKELRRSLGISKGNPLEIGIEGRRIVLEKYSSLSNLEGLSAAANPPLSDILIYYLLIFTHTEHPGLKTPKKHLKSQSAFLPFIPLNQLVIFPSLHIMGMQQMMG